MPDAPIATETPVNLNLKDVAKPAPAVPSSPEAPTPTPKKPPAPQDARSALQEIAAGPTQEATRATPAPIESGQAEQASPAGPAGPEGKAELGPDKEKVNMLLTQGAQLLLDAGDPKVAIAAVARSAAPTPLGTELRRDVLTMIADMQGDKLPAQGRENLTKLQQEITALNMPKTDPARSEFAKFLEVYSRQHPDKAIDPAVIEAIRTKKKDAGATITQVLQTDTGLSASLWAEMKGDRTETVPNIATADGLLTAAGLEATPENTANVRKLYEPKGPHPLVRLLQEIQNDIPSILITTGMLTMLASQFVTQESGGGGGH